MRTAAGGEGRPAWDGKPPKEMQTGRFSGRETFLSAIDRCRAQVAAGDAWAVVIEGEAGIGKTALARQAVGRANGWWVCWAGCDPLEQDLPFGLIDQILRRLPSEIPGAGDLMRVLTPKASPLAVGGDLLMILAAAADRTPTAIVIDDVPWADDYSVNALGFVLRRLFNDRLLVIFTARSHDSSDQTASGADWRALPRAGARVLPVQLAGLTVDETTQMAADAGGEALGRVAVERLHQRTAGHPLHLRSVFNQIPVSEIADLTQPLPLPATLQALVRQTLAGLPQDARRLVEALAVLDGTTPLATAAHLAEISDPSVALASVLASGLAHWEPTQPTAPVRIHHSLQRDAVYEAMRPSRRQALHARAATLVGVEMAWAHRVAATARSDPDLVRELADEAQRQAAQGCFGRAATLQLWAMDMSPSREQHDLFLLAAAIGLINGRLYRRAQVLRGAICQCAPSPRRDAVLGFLAATAGEEPHEAERLLTRARDTATDPALRLLAGRWLGATLLLRADGPKAMATLHPVVNAISPGPARSLAVGLLAEATAYADGPLAALRGMAEAGLPDQATQVPQHDSSLLLYRGMIRAEAGHLAAATEDLTTLIARKRTDLEIPSPPGEHAILALTQYLTGRWADAAINAEQALLMAETQAVAWAFPIAHAAAGLPLAQQGKGDGAQQHLDACRRFPLFPERTSMYAMLLQAVLAQAAANHQAVLQALRAVDDPARVPLTTRTSLCVLWAPLLIEAATASPGLDHADLVRAERALADYDQITSGAPASACTSAWLRGRLATALGHSPDALTHYRAAVATPASDQDDIPLHRAFCHRDLAHHLQALGGRQRLAEATHHLQEALGVCTALGATPYALHITDDLARLHPHQARIPHAAFKVDAALTEREQTIAHLAARGLTNQEIARELFLSPKTVEYHLGHVFTKLRLTSRRQLRTSFAGAAGRSVTAQ